MKAKAVLVEGLGKRFGNERVLDNVSLALDEGEYLCLLGASGSGKTTLLRLLAGLEQPQSGRIVLFGKDVTHAKPHARGIPLMFQHPALWPHMNVTEQISFGLEECGVDRRNARRLACSAIERVELAGLEKRMPGELSGGQQQRVALARALVLEAKVILLDEPLANLDAHLKNGMRGLLRRLSAELGMAALHVTHDREDAFELADRMAILNKGGIVACDTPTSLYRRPPTALAASLLGEVNSLPGRVAALDSDWIAVETELGPWRVSRYPKGLRHGTRVVLLFRPEAIKTAVSDGSFPERCNYFFAKATSRHFSGPINVCKLSAPTHNGDGVHNFTQFAFEEPGPGDSMHGRQKYHVSFSDIAVTLEGQTEEGMP